MNGDEIEERRLQMGAAIKELKTKRISQRAIAAQAGMHEATVIRYLSGATYDEATERRLGATLERLQKLVGIEGFPMTNGNGEDDLLLTFKGFPLDLTALRIEILLHEDRRKLRLAFVHDGHIAYECLINDREQFLRLKAVIDRMADHFGAKT